MPEHVVNATLEPLDLIGPEIRLVTPLLKEGEGYCVFEARVPPGVFVPIHAHDDRETFYIISGQIEGFLETKWRRFGAGDVFDVPGDAKHAFRNVSTTDVLLLVITTMALGRFFQTVGRPLSEVPPGPPSSHTLQRFAQASLAEGHWLGSVDDNAAIGISLSFS